MTYPQGRLNRAPFFWYSVLATVVFTVLVSVLVLPQVLQMLRRSHGPDVSITFDPQSWGFFVFLSQDPMAFITALVLFIVFQVVVITLTINRLHDLELSGWNVWLLLAANVFASLGISVVSTIAGLFSFGGMIYLVFFRGTDGNNRFGPDPRRRTASAAPLTLP